MEAFSSRSTPSGRRSAFRNSCRDREREHNQQCLHVGGKDLFASTNANSFSSNCCGHNCNAPSLQPITHTKSLASANRDLEATVNGEDDEGYESEQRQIAKQGFYIRRGLFKDLRCVADLMMDAFYSEKSIMFHYHRMLELDRVQNNFPYDSSKHEYYVACSPDGKVIGFVDIDARPSARKDAPPRPYLSDLAVSSEWRRKGIASRLVEQCEARARSMGKSKMYLRVEQKNDAALQMYCENMAYEERQHPVFGVKDTTILLRCDLHERLKMTTTSENVPESGSTCAVESEDIVLDYQV